MISFKYASRIRMLLRAVLVTVTAFGLHLSADQVAAVQLLGEAILAIVVKDAPTETDTAA